ncbi:hypothetical protein FH972_023042 [Carpinus fangiana]|uniref:DNL-type domain-containing protein n=1 Tax=Carpinus fangiana TaxID=176857 RepID=A0A5N6KU16_9ROSI|nr:hypothetical protein FH972_023042 [Carpinus fangiana]
MISPSGAYSIHLLHTTSRLVDVVHQIKMSKNPSLIRQALRRFIVAVPSPTTSRTAKRAISSFTQPCPRPTLLQQRTAFLAPATRRFDSSVAAKPSHTQPSEPRKAWRPAPHRNPDEPVYEMYFTCKVCKHRSAHTISKQGYHSGTTLVKCPGCESRHLISDHLKIFSDKSVTVEDLLAQKGESIEKATVDAEGDLEFWEDKAAGKGQ